jgi:hypothetical protein
MDVSGVSCSRFYSGKVILPTLDNDPTRPGYSFILSDVALFMLLGSDKITWKLSNFGVTKWSVITT